MILNRLQCSRVAILQSGSRPLPPPYLQPLHAPRWLGIYLNTRRPACCFWQRGFEAETPLPTTTTTSCPTTPPTSPFVPTTLSPSVPPQPPRLLHSSPASAFRELEPQTSSQRPLQTAPLCMCMSVCVFECMSAYPINNFPRLAEINNCVSGGYFQYGGVARVCAFSSKNSAE